MTPLSLGDLVDLEARSLEEQGDNEEVRRARYRQLGRRLGAEGPLPEDPGELLKALLRLDPRPDGLGRRFTAAFSLLQMAVSLVGLVFGASLSMALLEYRGEHPVNVLNVLAVLVGTQLVLLTLLLIALFPRSHGRASGPLQHALSAALNGLFKTVGIAEPARVVANRLDGHLGLLRWLLVRTTQIFGVSFNLGALAGGFARIASSDVAFGWSTTLKLSPDGLRRLTDVLSAPWSWFAPHAAPDAALIRHTQYSHLEGRYLLHGAGTRSLGPENVGGWWSFILFSISFYGLLPRLLATAVAGLSIRRILAETPRRNVDLARLCEWMRDPVVTTRPDGRDPGPSPVAAVPASSEPELPPSGTACELLDGAPAGAAERLRDRFGWTVAPGSDGPLVAVVSAWEEPTKGALRALSGLRNRLSRRLLVVALFDPGPGGADPARRERIRARWKRDLPAALDGLPVRVEGL